MKGIRKRGWNKRKGRMEKIRMREKDEGIKVTWKE